MPVTVDFDEYSEFFLHLAQISGPEALKYFRQSITIEEKNADHFDPVTAADRDTEKVIRLAIKEHFPGDGIIGEEFGIENSDAERQWIIDPIDGTRGFICGSAMWGTLIGLRVNQDMVFGMMHQPFVKETYIGDGHKSFRITGNEKQQLTTRKCDHLSEAFLAATAPEIFKGVDEARFKNLSDQTKMTRFGTDCYGYALLASGFIDIVMEAALSNYDILPMVPIITGAGGHVGAWDGSDNLESGQVLATGSKGLYEAAVQSI